VHPTFTREFEYKRHGTVSLLAGIDLVTGKVMPGQDATQPEFIDFLKLVDAAYPTHTAIRLILDNHSAHISKETMHGSPPDRVASSSPSRPSTAPG